MGNLNAKGAKVAAIVIALLLGGCAQNNQTAETSGLLAVNADGATVYQARCASCHGSDLRGSDNGPSQLSIVYEPGHHGDDSYRSAIRNGVGQHHWAFGNMPAVPDITDEQIERVIIFIRTQQDELGFDR
ncbi:MAG: mono/diheme cytochrome c family protein [Candidatus Poriferisodalaceae bacterium]|jgi:mono/diheme cytochrome c family protein|tara:strand:- start:53 stop:442 length:390 start_codon:yes stop_codon:yes gene_type:complete